MNTQHEITQIIADLQEKKKSTKRRQALDQLAQALSEETNSLSRLLTKNSLKSHTAKTLTKCTDYGWKELLFKVLIAFQLENTKKWVIKTKQMYHQLKLIIDLAETNGHFLKDIISEMIKLFQTIINDNDKLIAVGGCVFDILLKLLAVPIYQTKIKYNFYKDIFGHISNSFSPNKCDYFIEHKGWHHCSKHNANILANLLSQLIQAIHSSFSIHKSIQFMHRYIIPFYCRYFTNNTRIDSAPINAILLCTLNDLLYHYAFNHLTKYHVLCLHAFKYFNRVWDHNKLKNLGLNCIVKTQIIKFINLFFKIHDYLPDGMQDYAACFAVLCKLYRTFKSELHNTKSTLLGLNQKEILLGPQYSALKPIQLSHKHYEFYLMLSTMVHSMESIHSSQASNAIKPSHHNMDINTDIKRGKKRKRSDKEENDDEDSDHGSDIVIIEPPAKKQRTSLHTSKSIQLDHKNHNINNSLIADLSATISVACNITSLQFIYVYLYHFHEDITVSIHEQWLNGLMIQLKKHQKDKDPCFMMWILVVLSQLPQCNTRAPHPHIDALWATHLQLLLTETILPSPPNVLSLLYHVLSLCIQHKRIKDIQIRSVLESIMSSPFMQKKAFNTALLSRSFCTLMTQIFHALNTNNARNNTNNGTEMEDEWSESLSSNASSPSPLSKVFSRLNLLRISSDVSMDNNNHNNNQNYKDSNAYMYVLLEWLLKPKELNAAHHNDVFVFDYMEHPVHLAEWIVECITNMLYYDFVVMNDGDTREHEHYRYDQALCRYSETTRSAIGVVRLFYEDDTDGNEDNDDEDGIMSFMCYDNQSKSPFDTQHLVQLNHEEWKCAQFASFIKPEAKQRVQRRNNPHSGRIIQNITLIADILDTGITHCLSMIKNMANKQLCIWLMIHYVRTLCLITQKWQLHQYMARNHTQFQDAKTAEYHTYCKVNKAVLCIHRLMKSSLECLITLCVENEALLCDDTDSCKMNDSILYCIELLHPFIQSIPSNDIMYKRITDHEQRNYKKILSKRIETFAAGLSSRYWEQLGGMVSDMIQLLEPSYFRATNTKSHWESFGEGDVSAFITNNAHDSMSQITLHKTKSMKQILNGITAQLIIGDMIRFCSIHKYFVLHGTTQCYNKTAKRLHPYIDRIPPLMVRAYLQILYILQFPKPFLISQFVTYAKNILMEYKTHPYMQSEALRFLIHTSISIKKNEYECDNAKLIEIERLFEKIWAKLGVIEVDNDNDETMNQIYYPLSRYSHLLIISNCIQFQDNGFGEFGSWLMDLMEDEDYVLNQNINYIVNELLLSYGAPEKVFHDFLSNAVHVIVKQNETEDEEESKEMSENSKQSVLNSFSMLAHLAVVNVEFEQQVLFELTKIYILRKIYRSIVCGVVRFISDTLHFESPQLFIASHLEYILDRFCDINVQITSFPVEMMDESLTLNQFTETYQAIILSVLVKSRNMLMLKQVSERLHTSLAQLMHRHFAYVYCQSFCLLDNRSTYTKGDEILSSFFCTANVIGASPKEKIKNLLRINRTALLLHIIDYYAPLFVQTDPKYLESIKKRFRKCLETLATRLVSNVSAVLTGKFGIQIYEVLLYLIGQFENKTIRIHEKIGLLHITCLIFGELRKNDVLFPSTLRLVIHTLTNGLSASRLPLHCVNMDVVKMKNNDQSIMCLIQIVNLMIGKHFVAQSRIQTEIAPNYVCDILSALYALHTLDVSKYKIGEKVRQQLYESVSSIVTQLTTLRPAFAMIDFFPINMECIDKTEANNDCWFGAYKVWCDVRGNPALLTTLQAFNAHIDKKRNRKLLPVMLQTLDQTLCAKQNDVMDLWHENNSILCRTIENIMQIGAKYGRDYNLCKLAANCMSRFGLVHPSLYIEKRTKTLNQLICTQMGNRAGMKQRDRSIIRLIDSFLCHDDAEIMSIAMKCMIQVLNTKYGALAYSEMSDAACDLLKPLKNIKIHDDDPDDIHMADVEHDDVSRWTFDHNKDTFKSWICKVCAYLTQQYLMNTTSVLSCCYNLCRVSAHFAESVFPYIITDILHINTSPLHNNMHASKRAANRSLDTPLLPWMQTAVTLSYYFNTWLSHYGTLSHKILKLLLQTIQYVRSEGSHCENSEESSEWFTWSDLQKEHYKKVITKYNRRHKIKNRNSENDKEDDDSNSIAKTLLASVSNQKFVFPSHVFVAHLHLLNVANACLKMDQSMSAILYCHLWGMYEFGADIALSDVLSSSTREVSDCQRILMVAYNASHDTHGIYGIIDRNDGISASADGMLYEHERRYDYALRVNSMHQSQTGTARVLNGMGCYNLLYSYLDNIYEANANSKYLSEAYYECCWRICEWEYVKKSKKKIIKYNDKSIGFHGSILSALVALKSNDFDEFEHALCEGKLNLIRRKHCVKEESIQPLYGVMVEWAMFNAISSAWDLIHDVSQPQQLLCCDPLFDLRAMYVGRDFFEILHPQNICNNVKFIDDCIFSSFDFDFIEPLLSLHSTLFWILPVNQVISAKKTRSGALMSHLYCFAQIARKANRLNVAHRILERAAQIVMIAKRRRGDGNSCNLRNNEDILMEYCLKLEDGELLWSEGYKSRAIQKVQSVCNAMPRSDHLANEKTFENQQLRAESDCIVGEWLMLSHLRGMEETKQYLVKAESLCTNLNASGIKKLAKYKLMLNNSLCRASYLLAKFNDTIYNNLEKKLESHEWQEYMKRLKHQKEQISSLTTSIEESTAEYAAANKKKRNANKTKIEKLKQTVSDSTILKRRIEREYNHDFSKKQGVLKQRHAALGSAVQNYCNSLILDSKYDLFVLYRLISLWFDNYFDFAITRSIAKYFDKIASHKFIPLVYQIASRLSCVDDDRNDDDRREKEYRQYMNKESEDKAKAKHVALNYFYCVIYRIIHRMSWQHPYHCLYQIFQLCNVDKMNDSARIKTGFQVNKSKKLAAQKLICQLKSTKNNSRKLNVSAIVCGVESLIDAYCTLSSASRREKKKQSRRHGEKIVFPLSNYPAMLNIQNHNLLPIATANVAIDCSNVAFIERYKSEACLADSGITCPVIIDVLASNGKEYRELIKPQDDLRQDAVMQQVFCLVNQINRQYMIRSYRVVPLTATIGIVEWVKGTLPLGVYLNKAHTKYKRNTDYLPQIARQKMAKCAKLAAQKESNKTQILRATFDDICSRFPPVFHHFFLDQSSVAADWFAARLSYVISCAINSMVGYLLGLGDRHTQNILIDLRTSELIHIDLGVAFDQGKLLRTPELVPFRLTRDIVDGFGLNSFHGTFKKISVKVLKLLRENQQIFYTVLRVFVHDPLYKWSLDPAKMMRLQHTDENDSISTTYAAQHAAVDHNNNKNEQAERALHILKQKFQGNDNQHANVISVEGQVNRLILQAVDRNNLSQMFHGWCSWM
eukprot:413804_1